MLKQIYFDHFEIEAPDDFAPRFNIAPDSQILTIVQDKKGDRQGVYMRWGHLPPWAKSMADGKRQINARLETIFEKPSFRQSVRKRRCIVPASGFFEWKRENRLREPYWVSKMDGEPVAFAGIWIEHSFEGLSGQSVAFVTTEAIDPIAAIHHRMPLMLKKEAYGAWLDPALSDNQKIAESVKFLESHEITAIKVSPDVNNARCQATHLQDHYQKKSEPEQHSLF